MFYKAPPQVSKTKEVVAGVVAIVGLILCFAEDNPALGPMVAPIVTTLVQLVGLGMFVLGSRIVVKAIRT